LPRRRGWWPRHVPTAAIWWRLALHSTGAMAGGDRYHAEAKVRATGPTVMMVIDVSTYNAGHRRRARPSEGPGAQVAPKSFADRLTPGSTLKG